MDLIVSITAGLASSYFFLVFFLYQKKPIIAISENISLVKFNGEDNYTFKFVNLTPAVIFDVRVELTFYKPVGDFKGNNLQGSDIKLKDNFIAYIPRSNDNDSFNLHAMRLRTTDNLPDLWKDKSSFIRLTIIGKHALSGFNQVFVKDFLSVDCITTKKFQSGNYLTVK
ncbi:hypothetical protein [Aquirufa antheringensis]|jgi:hypothetical protein|uniref:hypothetical protein n=1 Tax=Aquirufa antheringensis TaxID=2516559 RepID=UPI001F8BE926|nr:hypothetical protein [Pseudarcicella sp. GAP-15]MCX6193203.1 hypothetical protein [Cytophagales bacterium]